MGKDGKEFCRDAGRNFLKKDPTYIYIYIIYIFIYK